MSVFGEVLDQVIKASGVQKQELAAALRKSDSAITHLISGRTKTVDLDTSKAISRVLDTPEDFWYRVKKSEIRNPELAVSDYLREIGLSFDDPIAPGIIVDHQLRGLISRTQRKVDIEETDNELDDDDLLIDPFDPARMKAVAYDTTIGGVWKGTPTEGIPSSLGGESTLRVGPQESIFVYTAEHFHMPRDIVGRLGPSVDLLLSGLFVAHGPLIAPLFRGRLTVAVQNLSNYEVSVQTDVRFMKVVFEKLQSQPSETEVLSGLPDRFFSKDLSPEFLSQEEERIVSELEAIRKLKARAR